MDPRLALQEPLRWDTSRSRMGIEVDMGTLLHYIRNQVLVPFLHRRRRRTHMGCTGPLPRYQKERDLHRQRARARRGSNPLRI